MTVLGFVLVFSLAWLGSLANFITIRWKFKEELKFISSTCSFFLTEFQYFCALAPKIHRSYHNTFQTFYLLSTFRFYVEVVKYSVRTSSITNIFLTICWRKFVLPSRLKKLTKTIENQSCTWNGPHFLGQTQLLYFCK